MNVKPSDLAPRDLYNLILNSVAPRPIAWVSTLSASGHGNLAPFSFFNCVCPTPPMLAFSPGFRASPSGAGSAEPKDTLRNVRETREFVISVVTYELAEAMNMTSGEYGSSVDEFDVARLVRAPSHVVKPPRVASSPVSFECKLHQIVEFSPSPESSHLVIGEVIFIHLDDAHVKEGKLDRASLDLIGRMGGIQYTRTTQRFDMVRPKIE
jgi:flavin reductase (DIM6/NTAB) family NADH-FMN oxidoreductase RutF